MSIRPIMICIAALAFALLTGCATTRGVEARKKAQSRLGLINSKLGYDQAEQAFQAGQFERALKELRVAINLYRLKIDCSL